LELRGFKKQLMDLGLLTPVLREPEEESSPPVGQIELGEDVFTARLLLRLGFQKGKLEADLDRPEEDDENGWSSQGGSVRKLAVPPHEGSDVDSESSLGIDVLAFENVCGITVPSIAKNSRGYIVVVYGWPMVCIATLFVQLLILYILLKNGMLSTDCLDAPLVPFIGIDWWLLHGSKLIAMLVSGAFAGREVMDIVNYCMVSALLETRPSVEVIISAVLRISLTAVILTTTMFVFNGLTNPADVWLNMTALHWISSLGRDMLDVAKRGVLGHHMCKAITGVEFKLTFVSEYPRWFKYVQFVCLLVTVGVVGLFAVSVFLVEEPVCVHTTHHHGNHTLEL
jgi:hypothetical protein